MMPPSNEVYANSTALAKSTKRINALTALMTGGIPAAILAHLAPTRPEDWVIGFLLGLLWANGFEYLYHRFLLHLPGSVFSRRHLRHHAEVEGVGSPEDVNFGSSPLAVMKLFLVNGTPVVALDLLFGFTIAPGMLIAFAFYLVVLEEIHWRIHMGESLPPGLRSAREYHLAHHEWPDSRFNVFLPLFYLLLCTADGHASLVHSTHSRLK